MTTSLIVLTIIFVLCLVCLPVFRGLILDKEELMQNPINEKFDILVEMVNKALFDGKGEMILFDDDIRSMDVACKTRQNTSVRFYYVRGSLLMELHFTYLDVELIHKRRFVNLRKLSSFRQKDIANDFIESSREAMFQHVSKLSIEGRQHKQEPQGLMPQSDPASPLFSLYGKAFNQSQRMSMINWLFLMVNGAGVDKQEFLRSGSVNTLLMVSGITPDSCFARLDKEGESQVTEDFIDCSHLQAMLLLLACKGLFAEYSSKDEKMVSQMIERMLELFDKIGLNENEILEMSRKIDSLEEM